MKKSSDKDMSYEELDMKLNNILTSQQKLWELVFKLDKDILTLNEVTARLLMEYKSIRTFEDKFVKAYGKEQGQPKKRPYY